MDCGGEEQMELTRFRDYVRGSRIDPESMGDKQLLEKGAEPYNCPPSRSFTAYKVKRSRRSGRFVTVRNESL